MFDSASAALATAVMAAYLATGSSMSTRSIFQPCGTNTPNFVDRAMLSPSFSNDRIADAKGRAIDNHGGRARARRRRITLFLYVASHVCVAHLGHPKQRPDRGHAAGPLLALTTHSV